MIVHRIPSASASRPRSTGWISIALRTSWYAWAAAVSVNVVIWLIVSLSSRELVYFWPAWVAGPWGAVLVVATFFGKEVVGPQRAARHRSGR
jgi:hypothetical protein